MFLDFESLSLEEGSPYNSISYVGSIGFLKNHRMSPAPFYGPIVCISAPNKTIETTKLIAIVDVISSAIF
jgi:hypothetical protein